VQTCIIVWIKEPKKRKLTRNEPEPRLKLELEKIVEQDQNERALNEMFYPPRSTFLHVLICPP